jgi:hypothetical protein
MRFTQTISAAVIVGLSVASFGLQAAEKKSGVNRGAVAPASASSSAVENLRTASALVRYGDAAKDPLALISAAKIMRANPTTESQAKREMPKTTESKNTPDMMDVDAVLARAKALSAGRADLIALADDVAKTSARGAEGGPKRSRTIVATRGSDVFRATFRGGERAAVVVSGDGDSDLDLYVADENGNQICKDEGPTDDMSCVWTPKWTGTFVIRVRNLGVANAYTILTN